MKRSLLIVLAVIALVVIGCGGSTHKTTSTAQSPPPAVRAQHALNAVHATQDPQVVTAACAQIPEGYVRHLGQCIANLTVPSPSRAQTPSLPLGIDTSHWDYCSGNIVRAPRFWFVALGDGNYVDPCARTVYQMTVRAGIPHGFYYFGRPYLDPTYSALHTEYLMRQAGYNSNDTKALTVVDDAEGISSCWWIYTYDNKLKSDLHLKRVIDYDSPRTWPGCRLNQNLDYTAEYGPIAERLFEAPVYVWQSSDGVVGPGPHCWGVCGDIDRLFGNLNDAYISHPKPVVHIAYTFWQACGALDAVTYWKLHGGHGHVSPTQHRHAVAIRLRIKRAHVGCSIPGWKLHPAQKYTSYPYLKVPPKYAPRQGALA